MSGRAFIAMVMVLGTTLVAAPCHADGPIAHYYTSMLAVFGQEHLIPVVIPRGERPGNVYEMSNLRLLADFSTCFPGLTTSPANPSTVPSITIKNDANVGLAVGVKEVASADIGLGAADETLVEFTDVTSTEVPAMALVAKFKPSACPFLASEVEATKKLTPMAGGVPLLVIGEVVSAKRNIHLTYKDQATAQGELSNWTKLITRLGLHASTTAAASSSREVIVKMDQALPIAVRPAFVPDQFANAHLGNGAVDLQPTWHPLDLKNEGWERHLIDSMAKALIESQPEMTSLSQF